MKIFHPKKLILTEIILSLALCLFGANPSFASFKDVPENATYIDGITFLELIGAIDNADYFRPNDSINRAEFFKILFKVFNEKPENKSKTSFKDVPQSAWFAPFAELVAENLLIEGDLFEPQKTVKRIDALTFLFKSYGVTGGITKWSDRTDLFKDVPTFHPYYSIIKRAVDESLITQDTEIKWRPFAAITRGELADMMLDFENWNLNRLADAAAIEKQNFYKADIFADIWDKITNDFYVPEGTQIDPEALFQAAVKGMIASLNDPYSTYFTSTQATEFADSISGEFEGIGAVLSDESSDGITGKITISQFIKDSPAEKSGLKIGDQITGVDGVTIEGMTISQVISRIKGPKNTDVTLTILRNGETLNFEITRAVIGIELITGKIVEKNVWFIDIDVFAGNTGDTLFNIIESLKKEVENPSAIVIDLRSNGGGYINAGNAVAGMFVPQLTPLVHLDYGGGYVETIYNGDIGTYYEIPLYIFVDGYTASASEILAQTLKEEDGAVVIGAQTFGKGTAQSVTGYWDGSALKITIAHWLSAEGTSINGTGITPDVLITTDGTQTSEEIHELYMDALQKLLD